MNQPLPINDQLKILEQIQELDLKLDNLRKNKNSLPNTLNVSADSLLSLQTDSDSKHGILNEMERVRRQTRGALDINQDRLSRSNTRLELVQNAQEFQAITKEIEQLKKMNLTLEEQLKKSDDEITACEIAILELTTKVDSLKSEHGTKLAYVTGENSKIDSEISKLFQDRSAHAKLVETRLLAQYDRVRTARGGLGIVPVADGRCKGCNIVLPPQLFNEVRKANSIFICPSCHRILFVPTQNPSQEINTVRGTNGSSESSSQFGFSKNSTKES